VVLQEHLAGLRGRRGARQGLREPPLQGQVEVREGARFHESLLLCLHSGGAQGLYSKDQCVDAITSLCSH